MNNSADSSTKTDGTRRMRFVDSHTAGEPTRVIIEGGPDLGQGSLAERLVRFRETEDGDRQWAISEPRGFEAVVGALLCPPVNPACAAGVIFFNNTGYLGMCGHGAMGVAVTLAYLGRIELGRHRLETPVGEIEIELLDRHTVAIENVPCSRHRSRVSVEVPSLGRVTGDIAWGGNWFFLVDRSPVPVEFRNLRELTFAAERVKAELQHQQVTGANGAIIDHIEFFGPAGAADAGSRNFVLCPGGAYDRSPCGTGTSAKLACLAADGKLSPGEPWIQESIIGSRFTASYRHGPQGTVIPLITGQAYICSEGQLIQQSGDPYRWGICGNRPR